jgi:hypothetical protein
LQNVFFKANPKHDLASPKPVAPFNGSGYSGRKRGWQSFHGNLANLLGKAQK